MKILFVTDLYPIGDEKIAKALYYFVLEWKKQGHIVEVIRPNFILNTKIRGRNIQKEGIYTQDDIKVYNLNFHTPFLFDVYNKLPDDFSLKNYDVMISHMPCGALMAQKLLIKKDKIPYACAVHSSDIAVLTKQQYSLFFKKKLIQSYKLADYIPARSPILKNKIENLIPRAKEKTFVAYSGIDDELIDDIDKYDSKCLDFISTKMLTITVVSSLIKRKNIDIVIEGLAKLKERDFFVRIIGDGEEKENLEKLVNEYSLEKNIKFLGNIPRKEVYNYLKKSSIFILLSSNETFGLSYLEAMSAMNIVIGAKNDGIDGILKNGVNSFLITQNPDELSKCIENIVDMNKNELENIYLNMKSTIKNYRQSEAACNYLKNLQ